jgi:hypothetical protein
MIYCDLKRVKQRSRITPISLRSPKNRPYKSLSIEDNCYDQKWVADVISLLNEKKNSQGGFPPIHKKRNNDREPNPTKALIVIYKDGSRELYCPAKRLSTHNDHVYIEFYNKILELKNIKETYFV